MTDLTTLIWPAARLGEALEALARTAGLRTRVVEPLSPHPNLPPLGGKGQDLASAPGHYDEALGRWIAAAAGHLGLEAEPMEIPYGEVESLLRQAGPALLRLPGDGEPCVLALVSGRRRSFPVLVPDLMVHRLRRAEVCTELCCDLEAPLAEQVDRLLAT